MKKVTIIKYLSGIFIFSLLVFLWWSAALNKNEWPSDFNVVQTDKTDLNQMAEPAVDKATATVSVPANEEKTPTTEKPLAASPLFIDWQVPFTSQAPQGEWSDKRQQDGCEEAAVLMALAWAGEVKLGTAGQVEEEIKAMADWQIAQYGSAADTNAANTAERLLKKYAGYDKWAVKTLSETTDIITELKAGHIILVPTNGQKLGNPFYKQPGPLTHMLVIKGYDETNDEFITNDPGTRRGANYAYKTKIIMAAAWDYATGDHEGGEVDKKNLIVVYKNGQEK